MKKTIVIFCCVLPGIIFGQKMPDYGINRIRIIETDRLIEAEVFPLTRTIHTQPTLSYYWYSTNAIHITQGGYSGRPLNGFYNAYYLNRDLRLQGIFKNGLKTGTWKEWNPDGSLINKHRWKNGVLQPDTTVTIWKRIIFWKRKNKIVKP